MVKTKKREQRNVNGRVPPGGRTVLDLTEDETARISKSEAREWVRVCVAFDNEMAAMKRAEAEAKRAAQSAGKAA